MRPGDHANILIRTCARPDTTHHIVVIPSDLLERLVAYPGINSIVGNKRVTTAEGQGNDGWITERRAKGYSQQLESRQDVPAVFLRDGGIFSLIENSKHLIINADGSLRAKFALSGGPLFPVLSKRLETPEPSLLISNRA